MFGVKMFDQKPKFGKGSKRIICKFKNIPKNFKLIKHDCNLFIFSVPLSIADKQTFQ